MTSVTALSYGVTPSALIASIGSEILQVHAFLLAFPPAFANMMFLSISFMVSFTPINLLSLRAFHHHRRRFDSAEAVPNLRQ